MQQCYACQGFVPANHHACPNCQTEVVCQESRSPSGRGKRKSVFKRANWKRNVAIAMGAAGLLMVTLMACYGGPPMVLEPPPDSGNTTDAGK